MIKHHYVDAGLRGILLYMPEPTKLYYPRLFRYLQDQLLDKFSDHILDIVPAYHSLLVSIDDQTEKETICHYLDQQIKSLTERPDFEQRINQFVTSKAHRIPVCYDLEFGIDLERIAKKHNISIKQVIELHQQETYQVYSIGFIPGFAYLGYVDDKIITPRLDSPRAEVAAGSVGIAHNQTGIYPIASPGGWNVIGKTPLELYAPEKNLFSLFNMADTVQFYSISIQEFRELSNEL